VGAVANQGLTGGYLSPVVSTAESTAAAAIPGADQVQRAIEDLLAGHDPQATDTRTFLEARFDAGLAWIHYPPGAGGLGLDARLQRMADSALHAGERVLGLPGDPRVDKDRPWRDVPRS
jgi:hypothetical protein